MTFDPQFEVTRRLQCASGHLNAVIHMAESGEPCDQILHQLNAVQAALRTAGAKMIECQARASQEVILNSLSVTERIAALHELQSLYAIYAKQFSTKNEVNNE